MNIDKWPTVLAFPLNEYLEQRQPVVKLWRACDVVELALRLLVALGLADLQRDGQRLPNKLIGELRSRVEMPTLGKWQGMAGAVASRIEARLGITTVPELVHSVNQVLYPMLDGPAGLPPQVDTSFKALRNQLAHGGGVSQAVARDLLKAWTPVFKNVIEDLSWLTALDLVGLSRDYNLYAHLRGPGSALKLYHFPNQDLERKAAALFNEGCEVVFLRQGLVMPLWPLIAYAAPRGLHTGQAIKPVPQVYLRRGPARLEMTPIGSEEACQSVADEKALGVFLELFRLKEMAPRKDFSVRDFMVEISQEASQLVGRAQELTVIAHALKQAVDEGDDQPHLRVLWISGEAGIGKSYLLAWIADQLSAEEDPVIRLPEETVFNGESEVRFSAGTKVLAYRFRSGDDRCNAAAFFTFAIERLGGEVASDLEAAPKSRREKNKALLDRLQTMLEERAQKGFPTIFFLDGLEDISDEEPNFAEDVPLGLGYPKQIWVCAGRPTAALTRIFNRPRCRVLFPGSLRMSYQDVRAMLLERVASSIRDKLIDKDREAGDKVLNPFIERVATYADGLPIYVHYVIEDIVNNRLTAFDEKSVLPQSIQDYHHQLISHLSLGGAWYVTPHLTALLAMAKEPLTTEILIDLLVRSYLLPPDDESEALVRSGLSALGSVICLARTPDEQEGFTIFHRSFCQHLTTSKETRAPILLAQNNFCRLAESPGGTGAAAASYLYRWGITHLIESGNPEKTIELLTDFDYLMDRLKMVPGRAGVLGIRADWNKVTAGVRLEGPAVIWEEFWRTREHLLLRNTDFWPSYKILLQLAWEHAGESPVTRAAEDWLARGKADWNWLRLAGVQRPATIRPTSLIRLLQGHLQEVTAAALTANGDKVLSGSFDGSLCWWDAGSGELLREFHEHQGLIKKIFLTKNDRLAVSASFDHTLVVWDLEARVRLFTLAGHQKPIVDAAVSRDGRLAASAGQDRTIRVWDLESGVCRHVLSGHKGLIRSVALLEDRPLLASGSLDRTVRIWDLETGKCLKILKGHTDGVNAVVEGGPGLVASAGRDAAIRIWDLDENGPPRILTGHQGNIDLLAITRDRQLIVSTGSDLTLRVWSIKTGQIQKVLTGHRAKIESMAITGDDRRLISGSSDGALKVWDLYSGEKLLSLEGNTGGVLAVAAARETDIAVSAGADRAVGVWNLDSRQAGLALQGHQGYLVAARIFPDQDRVLSAGLDGALRLWDGKSGQCLRTLEGGTRWYLEAAAPAATDFPALMTEENGDLTLWSLEKGRRLKTLAKGLGVMTAVGISPDGKWAAGARTRTITIWDLNSGEPVARINPGKIAVTCMALDWNDNKLLAGFNNGGLIWWDLNTRDYIHRLKDGSQGITVLALDPGRKIAAALSADGCLNLWNLKNKQKINSIKGLPETTETLALSQDGQKAVSLGPDLVIRVWDLYSGQLKESASLEQAPQTIPEDYSLLFPQRSARQTCAAVDQNLGLIIYRQNKEKLVWTAGYTWSPFMAQTPLVFERVGSVSVLRVLEYN